MRKVVYIMLFIGMVMGLVNLTLTNSLATGGKSLKSISHERTIKEQEISKLHQSVMEAQGLGRIEKRAAELGFNAPAAHVNLKIELLASRQ